MKASTYPMPTWRSSMEPLGANVSRSSASDDCYAPPPESVPSSTNSSPGRRAKPAGRQNGGAVLLPRTLLELSTRVEGDRIVINYLTERDYGWLRALLDEHVSFEGWKRTELAARLQEPLPLFAPKSKLRVAARVVDSLTRDRTVSALPPREARWRTFRAAAGSNTSRTVVLSRVASETDVSATELEAALFADLRGER